MPKASNNQHMLRVPASLLVLAALCFGTTGCDSSLTEKHIDVLISGSGVLSVTSGTVDEFCTGKSANAIPTCSWTIDDAGSGGILTAFAQPDPGWRIDNWGSGCSGAPTTCQFRFSPDQEVLAISITFVQNSPTGATGREYHTDL